MPNNQIVILPTGTTSEPIRGTLLLSVELYDGIGGDVCNIYVNSELRDRIYITSELLYSTHLYVGDIVYLSIEDLTVAQTLFLTLDRYDFTTDDENNDNGIKKTNIINQQIASGYTFTATTVANAYDFTYVFDNAVETDYQLWTEASQPILTENNAYINQEFT